MEIMIFLYLEMTIILNVLYLFHLIIILGDLLQLLVPLYGIWFYGGDTVYNPRNRRDSINTFTSGTRVEHTYAKAGTYTVKLAMKASSITFDPYDNDNGEFWALGNPTIE